MLTISFSLFFLLAIFINMVSDRTDKDVMAHAILLNTTLIISNSTVPSFVHYLEEKHIILHPPLTFYIIRLYSVGHMAKDHFDNQRGNPLPPLHGLLFSISSKG